MVGRPSKYNDEILQKTKFYLDNHEDEGDVVPSINGLAYFLKIRRSTLYEWMDHEDKKDFSDTLHDILAKQAKLLESNGLTGKFNSTIAKLMMYNHGYSDKQDLTTQGEKIESGVVILPSKDESSLETTRETGDSTS